MGGNRRTEGEGLEILLNFWTREYLSEYIRDGGSKIKFVTGRSGAGKTYFLRSFEQRARGEGYLTVSLSAGDFWLHDFSFIYFAVLEHCDLLSCLKKCAETIIREMGYDPEDIPEGQNFMDYLSAQGLADAITKKALRDQIRELFLQNPLLDNNFAIAVSLLTGSLLGHPTLEQSSMELILGWLQGERSVKLTQLRQLGLSPAKITKLNARHMLRSLAELVRMGGFSGLLILIDDLEILQDKNGNERIRYTRMRRDDTYESIRQLVDDIDSLRGIMFVYGFDRILIDNEKGGFKSYQALWMRIQNEVVGAHFNCFSDMINLDAFAVQEYTVKYLVELSGKLADQINEWEDGKGEAQPIDEETATRIRLNARFAGKGMPGEIREAILKEMSESEDNNVTDQRNFIYEMAPEKKEGRSNE